MPINSGRHSRIVVILVLCITVPAAADTSGLMIRYTATGGQFDPNFNQGREIIWNLTNDGIADIAIDVGNIMTCGHFTVDNVRRILLARYHADGTPDTSYGWLGATSFTFFGQTQSVQCAVDINFRTVVLATAGDPSVGFLLLRFKSNGEIDRDFAFSGMYFKTFSGATAVQPTGLKVTNDGKIYVTGMVKFGDQDMFVMRFRDDGQPDTTFSAPDGLEQSNFGPLDYARAITVAPNGNVYVVGETGTTGANVKMAVVRYTPGGNADGTFGTNGKRDITFPTASNASSGSAVQLDASGRLVIAGTAQSGNQTHFATARLKLSPMIEFDNSYSGDGRRTDTFALGAQTFDMTIQTDGKIVLAGAVHNGNGRFATAVLRYHSTGDPDSSLDNGGDGLLNLGVFTTSYFSSVIVNTLGITVAGITASF